jgi:ABC-type antimicrobial peptide transport system permease subunit
MLLNTTLLVGLLVALSAVGLLMAGLALAGKVPLKYNVRNLVVRWPVTLLTAVAFLLVVGMLTVMLAFVSGMYKLTEGSGRPENVMVLSDGATDELFSNLGFGDVKDLPNQAKEVLRDGQDKPLVSWETYALVNQPIPQVEHRVPWWYGGLARLGVVKPGEGRKRRFVPVRGIEDPVKAGQVHKLPLHPGGEWFSLSGVPQAVLGEGLARELGADQGKPSLGPGDEFELGPHKWVVTGVLQSAGSTFDSEVWVKFALVKDTFGKDSYTTAVLTTADAEAARRTAADLTANYKKPAVQASVEPEYYNKLNATNEQFLYAIIFITFFLMIGGVFAIMNTMFAAISQRTKDIGVLRILGFARWQVLMSFFLESLLLALVGGVLGCGVGLLADGWTVSSIISGGQGGGKSVVLKLIVDAQVLGVGLLFALVMGCLGGLLPGLSAMRLRPLESLR